MKRTILSIFSIFILIALPLQAMELDMSILNDISKEISNDLTVPTIVGPDDRKPITGKAIGPEKAVVVIGSVKNYCSGVMVGPDIVLTAAHCLIDKDGNYVKGLNVYAVGMPINSAIIPKTDNGPENKPTDHDPINKNILKNEIPEQTQKTPSTDRFAKSKEIWVPKKYIKGAMNYSKYRYCYDYGIIILDSNLGENTSWLGLKDISGQDLKGTNIIVIGRGKDKPEYTLWKSPGQIGDKEDFCTYYHNADILSGNSGGPVFKEDDQSNIIGLANWEDANNDYPNVFLAINSSIINLVNNRGNSLHTHSYLMFTQE